MAEVTVTEQQYLEALLHLHEAGLPLTAANVSRSLTLSAPTVHEMVKRLERDGLIERDARKRISFTDQGLSIAREVASRHRIVERFLTDVLQIPWHQVHDEAARIDRTAGPVVLERMRQAIAPATTCPHGHPLDAGNRVRCGARLAEVAVGDRVTVLRFENEQPDVLGELHAAGLRLGLGATVVARGDDGVVLESADGEHRLSDRIAGTVTVWVTAATPAATAG